MLEAKTLPLTNNTGISPARILETGLAFWSSKVLLTATKLDLFTYLADQEKTGEELRTGLGLQQRGLYDFLDALVALSFLNRQGSGPEAIYTNTPETALFLDKNKPAFVGGMLVMANNRLYPFWNDLETALKTGKPQNEVKTGGRPLFEELYADENRLSEFVSAMAGTQMGNFIAFAERFNFDKYKTHCDIGGAGGHLAAQIVMHNPHIQSTTFDLPAVAPVALRNLFAAGLGDGVKVASGNFFTDAFPTADIFTMGNILHDWDLATKKMLIKKAYDALPVGGALAVIENVIDDERKQNVFGLLMSLNMLIETDGGFDYTSSDFIGWAKEAGFVQTQVIHLSGPSSALVAFK
jgi:O-methyltransferase/methyltransferase family protein